MEARLTRRRFLGFAALGLGAAAVTPAAALARSRRYVDPGPPLLDLRSFGVVADGRTDDGPALARAFVSLKRAGGLTLARPGTLLVSRTVVVPDGVFLDLAGSTVLRAPGMAGPALLVPGAGVVLQRLTVDGNRRGRATGPAIEWQGAHGGMWDATLTNTDTAGLVVRVAGGDVFCVRVTSTDHVSGVSSADGFYAALGGRLRLHACRASENDRAGVYLEASAADGCVVDGAFDRNRIAGAYLKAPRGTSTLLQATDNDRFGVIMKQGAGGWVFGRVEVTGSGRPGNTSVTGVELYGAQGNSFAAAVVRGVTGYGVALAKGDVDGTPASGNSFDLIDVDRGGTGDSDPGLHLSGGATRNTFGTVRVVAMTAAISIGEGYLPLTNDGNTFQLVHAERCPYTVVIVRGGSGNRFERIEAVGCSTVDPKIAQGLVDFTGPSTLDNVVTFLDASQVADGGARAPLYLAFADAQARGNQVLGGRAGPSVDGAAADRSGGNSFNVA